MLWIPASFNLGGRELSHCTKGCCHPEMSHCHWSSSSPLRYSCLCWCSGLGYPACPAHTGCVSCSQKNCPSREAQVRTVVRTAQGGEDRGDWRPLWQFGERKTERQNLGSDPCQGQCFSCEGRAAAPTGAGSTQCTGSSHCRPLLSYFKCNSWSCAKLALPMPATPIPHVVGGDYRQQAPIFKNNWQMSQKSKCFPL